MTKDKTVTMSRELAQSLLNSVEYLALRGDDIGESNVPAADELRTLLAAPVVERQPVATVRGVVSRKSSVFDIVIHDNQALHPGTKLYASPPAPVAVVLPEPVAEVVATGGPHDQEDRVLVELQAELPPIGTKVYTVSIK